MIVIYTFKNKFIICKERTRRFPVSKAIDLQVFARDAEELP